MVKHHVIVSKAGEQWLTVESTEKGGALEVLRDPRVLTLCVSALILLMTVGWLGYLTQDDGRLGAAASLVERHNQYATLVGISADEQAGQGVAVCIVDTGIDLTHPSLDHLSGSIQWFDAIDGRGSPYDDHGHGTAMAGILVSDEVLEGHAQGVDLLVAKALGADGSSGDHTLAEAVRWCSQRGADIISLSLGGADNILPGVLTGDESEDAIDEALDNGVIVVAAAGNDGGTAEGEDVAYPGSIERVISVGGIHLDGTSWEKSNRGDNEADWFSFPPKLFAREDPHRKPEVVAPAVNVPILYGDNYGQADGTSAATVFVTAGMARLLQANPELQHDGAQGGSDTIQDIKGWLMDSSTGVDGHDDALGYGQLSVPGLLSSAP